MYSTRPCSRPMVAITCLVLIVVFLLSSGPWHILFLNVHVLRLSARPCPQPRLSLLNPGHSSAQQRAMGNSALALWLGSPWRRSNGITTPDGSASLPLSQQKFVMLRRSTGIKLKKKLSLSLRHSFTFSILTGFSDVFQNMSKISAFVVEKKQSKIRTCLHSKNENYINPSN